MELILQIFGFLLAPVPVLLIALLAGIIFRDADGVIRM